MRDPQEFLIGGVQYTITPLPADESSRMLLRILKVVGPALDSLEIEVDDVKKAGAKLKLGKILASVSRSLDEKDLDYFRDKFASSTRVELGQGPTLLKSVLSHHFAGDLGPMFEWIQKSLEVNFGGFFTDLRAKLANISAPASPTKAP